MFLIPKNSLFIFKNKCLPLKLKDLQSRGYCDTRVHRKPDMVSRIRIGRPEKGGQIRFSQALWQNDRSGHATQIVEETKW